MIDFKNVRLSDYTTIKLGGETDYFIECKSNEEIIEVLKFAKENKKRIQILGGGSNTIFPDEKFDGIVLKINLQGIKEENGILKVGAGVEWDEFVKYAIEKGYQGVECLSGIPGIVGATPIQNVGAYGQEVCNVIEKVISIQRDNFEETVFGNSECDFSYRNSRFKSIDKDKYIITDVHFRLNKDKEPVLEYKELKNILGTNEEFKSLNTIREKLEFIRKTVLEIRRKKSMVLDENDVNTYSCGSFFTNPIIDSEKYKEFEKIAVSKNLSPNAYKTGNRYKLSAAYLIENSGYKKGFTKNGIGISEKHSLALINRGGTTKELIFFAEEIINQVRQEFGITLEIEPIIV